MRKLRIFLLGTAGILLFFSACKKDRNKGRSSREGMTNDSIFLYAKETYLGNDKLPSYEEFKPRSFPGFAEEVNAVAEYAPLDKYSFIDDGTVSDELGGQGGD